MTNPDTAFDKTSKSDAQFALQKIYVKDISFESPTPTDIFLRENISPDINIQLNTESSKLKDGVFEVVLNLTVTATLKEEKKTIYLVEIKQAGIFTIANFTENDLAAMINSYCPNILFPFARELISSLVERGGYPQLLLAPINFDALYQQHLQKIQQGNKTPASDSKH